LGFVEASFLESIGVADAEVWNIWFNPEEIDKIYADWEKFS
jgi:hypothetical protein